MARRCSGIVLWALLVPSLALAQLQPPGPPDDPAAAFYTLGTILDRLQTGAVGAKSTGGFAEPTAGPATTGPTLDDLMAAAPFPDDLFGASPNQCLEGQRFWSLATSTWGPRTGSMPNRGGVVLSPGTDDLPILLGFHDGTGFVEGDRDLISGNIRDGVTLFGVLGDPNVVDTSSGTAVAADLVTGRRAWVDGNEVVGSIPLVQLSDTTTDVPAGLHAATTLEAIDPELVSGNLRSGVTVFGIAGDPNVVDTSSGTATAAQIAQWARAWVDGNEVVGTAVPEPRFINNGDGTVTDPRTGLVWLRDASCSTLANTNSLGQANWSLAFSAALALESGNCGLTDGSVAGDWRMPRLGELWSLVNPRLNNPAVPNGAGTGRWREGDVFIGLETDRYWTFEFALCPPPPVVPAGITCHWTVAFSAGNSLDHPSPLVAYILPVKIRPVPRGLSAPLSEPSP